MTSQAQAKSTGFRVGIIVMKLNILAPAQALLSLAGIRTSSTRRTLHCNLHG